MEAWQHVGEITLKPKTAVALQLPQGITKIATRLGPVRRGSGSCLDRESFEQQEGR